MGAPLAGKKVADEFEFSIATVPPTARQRRLAVALIIVLFIGFSVTAPFAATQLARIDSFVPAVEAINIVTDLVTAILLFSKFPLIGLESSVKNRYLIYGSALQWLRRLQNRPW